MNDDRDALLLWKALEPSIKSLIKESTSNSLKRLPATVISTDNVALTAVVRLILAPDEASQNMTVFNDSGKPLTAGDNVFLDYWSGLTNAYISRKNDGEPTSGFITVENGTDPTTLDTPVGTLIFIKDA